MGPPSVVIACAGWGGQAAGRVLASTLDRRSRAATSTKSLTRTLTAAGAVPAGANALAMANTGRALWENERRGSHRPLPHHRNGPMSSAEGDAVSRGGRT